MFFIAYTLKGQAHLFAGRVKIVSVSSCRTRAILKYFCPLQTVSKDYQQRSKDMQVGKELIKLPPAKARLKVQIESIFFIFKRERTRQQSEGQPYPHSKAPITLKCDLDFGFA